MTAVGLGCTLMVVATALAVTCQACQATPDGPDDPSAESAYTSEEGDAVRIALAATEAQFPDGVLGALERDGIAPDPQPRIGGTASRELASGLVGETGASEWYGPTRSGAVVRVDGFTLKAAMSAVKVKVDGETRTFPFAASAGARVEFAKVFPDERSAVIAPRPMFWSIPADAARALALPEGTYVSIPMRGEVATRVSGSFLSLASGVSREAFDLLNASAVGHLSAGAQGALVAKGDFTLEVVRLPGKKVRLRVSSRRVAEAAGGVTAGGNGRAALALLPASPLGRARSIARLVSKGLRTEEQWNDVDARVAALEARLTPELKKLLAARDQLGRQNASLRKTLEQAHAVADPALALVTAPGSRLDVLEQKTYRRVDAMLERLDASLKVKLPAPDAALRRFTDHALSLQASVALSAKVTESATRLGDYVFDLGTPEGREAYDHAVSGRAVWLASREVASPSFALGGHAIADLSFADALADEDFGAPSPRVVRVTSIDRTLRKEHVGVTFQGLGASASFDRSRARQELVTTDAAGRRTEVTAHLAEVARSERVVGSRRSERHASGFVTLRSGEDPARGSYWFRWQAEMGADPEPVKSALAGSMNLLGPRAVALGLPLLYGGERPGEVSAQLDVVVPGSAIDAFFRAPPAVLWKSLGDMAETYDNQFGLPRLGAFAADANVPEANGERAACDKVARAWGGFYCGYFRDRFAELPRVAPEGRLAYLRQFYEKTLLANPIGSKFVIRLLAQVTSELGVAEDVHVKLSVINAKDASLAASPTLSVGDGAEVDLALAILQSMR